MEERKYRVLDKDGNILAMNMAMDIALTLIQALTNIWYNEEVCYTIKEEPR